MNKGYLAFMLAFGFLALLSSCSYAFFGPWWNPIPEGSDRGLCIAMIHYFGLCAGLLGMGLTYLEPTR